MIPHVILGVAAVAGVAAAQGAVAAVARGFVRGFGRLVEGEPVAALKEVAGGILEPFVLTVVQTVNLAADAANVVVFTGARLASVLSPQTRELVANMGGFDNALAGLIVWASLPDPVATALPPENPRFAAALDSALREGKTEFVIDGITYKAARAAA